MFSFNLFGKGNIWRQLTNVWTFIFFVFLIWNFFALNKYEFLVGPLSIVYTGVLSVYVGTKEFERWCEFYEGRHPGELFVIGWTILLAIFSIISILFGNGYTIPSEVVADYIMVLSLFALTQKSKKVCRVRHQHQHKK